MILTTDSLQARINAYQDTLEQNDRLHLEFSQRVETIPFLIQHRRYVETHRLGFGDAAFHYLWYLLLQQLNQQFPQPRLLEIGVYKGQVISLWQLIADQLGFNLSITGISPFKGNPLPKTGWQRRWKWLVNPQFRWQIAAGNIYSEDDYKACIQMLFQTFALDLSSVRLIEGYSSDSEVLEQIQNEKFSLIYIDGDHTYEGVLADLQNYSHRVELDGFLVMDDASYYRPGSMFWKGHEPVSRASELMLPRLGFVNVLNVGHNRVYRRVR